MDSENAALLKLFAYMIENRHIKAKEEKQILALYSDYANLHYDSIQCFDKKSREEEYFHAWRKLQRLVDDLVETIGATKEPQKEFVRP